MVFFQYYTLKMYIFLVLFTTYCPLFPPLSLEFSCQLPCVYSSKEILIKSLFFIVSFPRVLMSITMCLFYKRDIDTILSSLNF